VTTAQPQAADIAGEVLEALAARRATAPFSHAFPQLDLDQAYAVTADLRRRRIDRGETAVGRKIGFTNRDMWTEYNVSAPIWGDMYASTVHRLGGTFALSALMEPRIEPEIVFRLATAVVPGMTPEQLLGAIEWVAHGFEIVQSVFPGWRFAAADAVAAGGLHGALLLGPALAVKGGAAGDLLRALSGFTVTLRRNGETVDEGRASNVLGGPLLALGHLAEVLARDPHNPPLRAGEVVTTGTLTRAFPIAPGETWTTSLEGIALDGLAVSFV
jgi:2-oxo-3-hexenedioate decarboxylase